MTPGPPPRRVTIIGDRLNRTCRRTGAALAARDAGAIVALAGEQLAAGAAGLDVNAGGAPTEADDLVWMVRTVRSLTDVPLWIDTTSVAAAEAAIRAAGGRPVLNGVSLQAARCEPFIRLARRFDLPVVAQCLTDEGVPRGFRQRLERAHALLAQLSAAGFDPDRVYLDPCLTARQVEPDGLVHVDRVARHLRDAFPDLHAVVGVRNYSWGLAAAVRRQLDELAAAELAEGGLDTLLAEPARLVRTGSAADRP